MSYPSQLLLPTTVNLNRDKEAISSTIDSLNLILNRNAIVTNQKTIGIYSVNETLNGQQFYIGQPLQASGAFRTLINFGALPNAGTKSVTTTIQPTATYLMVRMYGTANDTNSMDATYLNSIPIPYASAIAVADNLELYMTVNGGGFWVVNITTGTDYHLYNQCYVVLEYTKF